MRTFFDPLSRNGVLRHAAIVGLLLVGCADADTPTEIRIDHLAPHFNHNAAAGADKGYLAGWLDGEDVSLHYTKWFFCEEPPESGAASGCVIGAESQVDPRPGRIPTIYAIAAVGIQPDVATLACAAGSVCLDHPAMLDASASADRRTLRPYPIATLSPSSAADGGTPSTSVCSIWMCGTRLPRRRA